MNPNAPSFRPLVPSSSHLHRLLHWHFCGCTYLTATFFDDHAMFPPQCMFPSYHFTPFKYVGNFEPDETWPARQPSTPSHRTARPVKSALRTKKGPRKTANFGVALCAETNKPVPPPTDPGDARRRWYHANACLREARDMLLTMPDEEEQSSVLSPPTEPEQFTFLNQDMQVQDNIRIANHNSHEQTVDAVCRGILDLLMFVHTRKDKAMRRIRRIVNREVTEHGTVGSYTGDEMIYAERAWAHTIIPLWAYADPSTALSYSWTTPPAAYMIGANAQLGGLLSEKTWLKVREDYEPDEKGTGQQG
ncbi:hypothetical protein B0J13DRAFT_648371 [Dactylonectria estremocensis]|uniref:Uncharacterized protein n=1 Tax=Dactylonectria estremocensis TaxID=1079267 RepID=A0A9P9DK37_9HYPO|nr:hypothetical protein B0J13DRAFT_648371 [Dactylonectria estremocensis]